MQTFVQQLQEYGSEEAARPLPRFERCVDTEAFNEYVVHPITILSFFHSDLMVVIYHRLWICC
jgi:hypothetical protein